jgi:hypothetical protein
MGLTNFPNGLTSFGMPVTPWGVPFCKDSQYFFVDPAYGNDGSAGTFDSPLATVTEAEDRCIADQHDTVFVIARDMTAANTTTYLTAALAWDKDLTHLIGIGTQSALSQRARIAQYSSTTGLSPMITVSASGCTFKNLQIFQGVDDNTSLINVKVTGGRNYFENVHFAGGGHATMAIDGGCSLFLDAAEENMFNNCTIGVDTIGAATGYAPLVFDNEAKRNIFKDCRFIVEATATTVFFFEVLAADGVSHWNLFDGCFFYNASSSVTIAEGAQLPAITTNGILLMKNCMAHKITKWDNDDRGKLYGSATAYTAADLACVAVAFHV